MFNDKQFLLLHWRCKLIRQRSSEQWVQDWFKSTYLFSWETREILIHINNQWLTLTRAFKNVIFLQTFINILSKLILNLRYPSCNLNTNWNNHSSFIFVHIITWQLKICKIFWPDLEYDVLNHLCNYAISFFNLYFWIKYFDANLMVSTMTTSGWCKKCVMLNGCDLPLLELQCHLFTVGFITAERDEILQWNNYLAWATYKN
jgi:hypothetical protein